MIFIIAAAISAAAIAFDVWSYRRTKRDLIELMALIGDAHIETEKLRKIVMTETKRLDGLKASHAFLLEAVSVNMKLTEKCYHLASALGKIYEQKKLPEGSKVN